MTLATPTTTTDTDWLTSRVAALRVFVDTITGCVPDDRLARARAVLKRAGTRLALSGEHTVVALAGATGSGKSSLFNAVTGLQLSQVGVRRPTTGVTHACVWGHDRAKPLLDWLGIPATRRFSRESALDGNDEAGLRGLVLLDLPDFDSDVESHRDEVDRLLELVDLVVWVLDPQKYADKVIHDNYMSKFSEHRGVTVVVLNQIDKLRTGDAERVVTDLRRLLDHDGLVGVPLFATSTVATPGTGDLRAALEHAVTSRQAMLYRLAADVSAVTAELAPLFSVDASEADIDRSSIRQLSDVLADAAGVPAIVEATETAYRYRALKHIEWPPLRWLSRFGADPLRHVNLPGQRPGAQIGLARATGFASSAAEKAAVTLAGRAVARRAARGTDGQRAEDDDHGLPEPWPTVLSAASRSRANDVPDALDAAISQTSLGLAKCRPWWRVIGWMHLAGSLVAVAGLGWLVAGAFLSSPTPDVGFVSLPVLLLVAGVVFGLSLRAVARPFARIGADRARRSADRKLRNAVTNVASELIVGPVRDVLRKYGRARDALAVAQN